MTPDEKLLDENLKLRGIAERALSRAEAAESTLARILEILAPAVDAVKGATGGDWSITNDKSRCAVASSSYAASVARGVLLRDATAIVASINAVRDLEGMIEEVGK